MALTKDNVVYTVSEIVDNSPVINIKVTADGIEPLYYWFNSDNSENLEQKAYDFLLQREEYAGGELT